MAGMTAAAGGAKSTAAVAVAAAVAAAMVAAIVAPAAGAVAAPLIVVAALALVGARRPWGLHRALERSASPCVEHGLEPADDTDDECELSTFAALQRAEEHLELAGLLLDETAPADMVAAHGRLAYRLETFVFSGLGLGDLAAAWAIEQACEALADDALSDRRRPAA